MIKAVSCSALKEKNQEKEKEGMRMNRKLTDFDEAKESVIGHHRAMNRKPEPFRLIEEEDSMLDNFLSK